MNKLSIEALLKEGYRDQDTDLEYWLSVRLEEAVDLLKTLVLKSDEIQKFLNHGTVTEVKS